MVQDNASGGQQDGEARSSFINLLPVDCEQLPWRNAGVTEAFVPASGALCSLTYVFGLYPVLRKKARQD